MSDRLLGCKVTRYRIFGGSGIGFRRQDSDFRVSSRKRRLFFCHLESGCTFADILPAQDEILDIEHLPLHPIRLCILTRPNAIDCFDQFDPETIVEVRACGYK